MSIPPLRGQKECSKGSDCPSSKCKIDAEGYMIIGGFIIGLLLIFGIFGYAILNT